MKKKIYKVGVIGCGRIASLLEDDPLRGKPASHTGAYAAHPKTKIVAGCDINPDRLKIFGKRWGARKLFADYRDMIDKTKPDIVSVTTWTESHSEIVTYAAKAGVRGIFCEKPVAVNLPQARKMIKACDDNGVAMVVGHERRWDWRYQTIRRMLVNGELGTLRSITGYTLSGAVPKLSRKKYGGGPMFHDGTHLVDLFRYFAGDAESVIAFADRPFGERNVENTAAGIINFANGARGLVIGGGERKYFHFELDIQTDRARALLGNHTAELYMVKPSGRFSGFSELEEIPFPEMGNVVNAFVGGVDDLVTQMETGRPSISTGEDGYRALELILAMYKSADANGALVKLPLR